MNMNCPVNSHNEWDPGRGHHRQPAPGHVSRLECHQPRHGAPGEWDPIEQKVGGAGQPYPAHLVAAAQRDLQQFVHILQAEGVRVRTVEAGGYAQPFGSPDWSVPSGFCVANPRDPFLVIGNEIIETPMADRGRYFEAWAYRSPSRSTSRPERAGVPRPSRS